MIKKTRNNTCKNCPTDNCFIKKYCSEESIELIDQNKESSIYRRDQHIAYEGSIVLGLYFIREGKVKILSSGLQGKSQLVRLTKTGDIIGHRGYGGEKYPISAIAIIESSICFINNDTIFTVFMKEPNLTFALMMYYSKELRKSEAKIKNQAQMNVREKVADALLCSDNVFNESKSYPSDVQLNRKDLADLAGINTEQLSRVLSEFRKEEVISVLKNKILLNNSSYLKEIISPFGFIE